MPLSSAALIGAGMALDAASSGLGALFNTNQARKNRAFQERMYFQQLEDNRENWRMENEYNLPSAQVQRLKDANLNPLLMYSGGLQNVSGNIVGPQQPSGAQATADFHTNFAQGFQQLAQIESEIKNRNADTELKIAQGMTELAKAKDLAASAGLKNTETSFNIKSMEDRLNAIKLQNKQSESISALNAELAKTEPKKREEIDASIAELQKKLDVYNATIDDIQNQIKNRDIITEAQKNQIEADIRNANRVTAATVYKLNMEGRKAFAEAFILEIEGAIKDMPEWQAMQIWKEAAELRKVIAEGDETAIANGLNHLTLRFSDRSQGSETFQKFLNSWVNPIMDSVGKILGPAAGGYAGARLGRR